MELILAYIDPGSGSLIIQALIAGLVAVPVIFRNQIRRFMRSVRGQEDPPAEAIAQDDNTANGA